VTFGFLSIAVLGRLVYVLSRPEAEMLSYVIDDAFYYLVPAHSFAHGEGWSHDGLTRTSGFQVLYGYIAAAVARVTGLSPALPATMAAISTVALLAGVYLLSERAGRLYGAKIAAAAVVLVLATPSVPWQITNGLEWSWIVLTTVLFVGALLSQRAWIIALAACLAVLVRVDLAIFVAVFALVVAPRQPRLVACAAAGAGIAVAVTALNSRVITGDWIPNSVATKQFWASTTDFLPAVTWSRLIRGTGPGFVLTELRAVLSLRSFVVIGIAGVCALALCRREWRRDPLRGRLALASTVAIAAYTLAYARGTNVIGDHYSGSIFVPMFALTCALLLWSGPYWTVTAAAVAIGAVVLSRDTSWRAPYQLGIAEGAPSLIAHVPNGSRVAAWNAGLAGWQTGKRVTNLDGLANADVVPAMRTGTLACYLRDAGITHIMDYGFMFAGQIDTSFSEDEESRRRMLMRRNGYDAAKLYRCAGLIGSHAVADVPSEYRLFVLDSACVAALCDIPTR
jgi:hypothetical protein